MNGRWNGIADTAKSNEWNHWIIIIIHLGRLRDKTRKVLQIVEVEGYEDGRIQTKVLYEFKEEGMKNGKIQGFLMKKNEITNKEKLLAAGYHTI